MEAKNNQTWRYGTTGVSDKMFAFVIATLVTCCVFSIFAGQGLFSDVVTFHKSGDDLKGLIASFQRVANGSVFYGVDTGTFNGSIEPLMKPGLPTLYPFTFLFAQLLRILPLRLVYILFFAFHMFLFLYYGILLGLEFFGLHKKYAVLCAISSVPTLLVASWYLSFYIVVALTFPVFYYGLKALREKKRWKLFLYSLPYVFCFLSGYTPLSLFAAGFLFLSVLLYGLLLCPQQDKKEVAIRALVPVCIAGAVCLPYYLQLVLYQGGGSSPVSVATAFPFLPQDLLSLFFRSYSPVNRIEGQFCAYVGLGWLLVFLLLFPLHPFRLLDKGRKRLLQFWIGCALLFLFIAMGNYTPLQYWFYSVVPILGSMHLPIRFLQILMPTAFLAVTLLLKEQKEGFGVETCGKVQWGILLALGVLLLTGVRLPQMEQNILVLELILLLVFVVSLKSRPFMSWPAVVSLLLCTIVMPINTFYAENEVSLPREVFAARSILYDDEKKDTFNRFVSQLPEKELYRFVSFEPNGAVPDFVPNNLSWYDLTIRPISNYIGYDLHTAVNHDYMKHFLWFDRIDWEYVADTRGDFVVLAQETVEENLELYDKLLELSVETPWLDATHRMYALKRFIPSHYTGQYFVVDRENTLDNGYFYCPDLERDSLLDFSTDETSYFKARIATERPVELAFLPFPNEHFSYMVDGEEIAPVTDRDQVFIPLAEGVHEVVVTYQNTSVLIMYGIMAGYYILWVGLAAVGCLKKFRRGHGSLCNNATSQKRE